MILYMVIWDDIASNFICVEQLLCNNRFKQFVNFKKIWISLFFFKFKFD